MSPTRPPEGSHRQMGHTQLDPVADTLAGYVEPCLPRVFLHEVADLQAADT